jgi:hypothetical protein
MICVSGGSTSAICARGRVLLFLLEKMIKSLLRADMMRFQLIQFLGGFNAGSNRHKAVQAPRIVCAVFILRSAIHGLSKAL